MFAKPYKLKSNNTLKNSEKKQLVQKIKYAFPSSPDAKLKELVPVKSNSSCMRVALHSGQTVGVYVVDGVPVMIESEEWLVPTVCGLWKVPEMVPTIIIHAPVLSKVLHGAPLYIPGVEVPAGGAGFPRFGRGAVVAASTTDNSAAAIVGRAQVSSGDILMTGNGICLETIQVFGDLLTKEQKFVKLERPMLGPASYGNDQELADNISQLSLKPAVEEWPALGPRPAAPSITPSAPTPVPMAPTPPPHPTPNAPKIIPENEMETAHIEEDSTMEQESSSSIPEDMDGLLQWSLLALIKTQGSSLPLPLKTNLLYKNYMMPLCPDDRTLDVKKSSYKKMSKFLEVMQQQGVIEVMELEKGVWSVTALSGAHPLVRGAPRPRPRPAGPRPAGPRPAGPRPDAPGHYSPPLVRDMFCITANVQTLFREHKKGTALSPSEVRSLVMEYVKSKELASHGSVTLDDTLAGAAGKNPQDNVKYDELMSSIMKRMTSATEIRFPDEVKLIKSKLEPITMSVVTRSGNKKVTLVSNLESYGMSVSELARVCQLAVGASCGVTRRPGASADQLMLQGDQTHFVAKLLIEKYGLPKKFLEGADKALNKKK